MPEWKALITDGLDEEGQTILRSCVQVRDCPDISTEQLLQEIGAYHALIVRSRTQVTAQLFAQATRLKVVGRAGVGVDNIDLEAAASHGVTVVNTPQATTLAVAEHTLALMLAMARSIPRADLSMKAGRWAKKELQGVELSGKVLGIIGMGNIGAAVAQRAAALGMEVIAFDPLLSPEVIRQRGAESVALSQLYARADFISLHTPLTSETRGMIGAQAFLQMKPGVRLVCTARGGLIDESALLAALENGRVAAAALDVFAKEPPGASPLVVHPKVIATPHIGAQTAEAQRRAAVDIAQEVLAALQGKPLRWRVV